MTVNSILSRDCKEARNEWFPAAVPCREEMFCSQDHVCANFGWNHCNYACLSTCICDGVLTVAKFTTVGPVCICDPDVQLKQVDVENDPSDNSEIQSVDSDINCKSARQSLYPTALTCSNEMKCGENQACADLSAENCQFTCLKKEECPCDLTSEGFKLFWLNVPRKITRNLTISIRNSCVENCCNVSLLVKKYIIQMIAKFGNY